MALPVQSSPLIFQWVGFANISHFLKIEFKALAAFISSPFEGYVLKIKRKEKNIQFEK